MMESSIPSSSGSSTPPFDNDPPFDSDGDLVVVTEEPHDEAEEAKGVEKKTDQAASTTTTISDNKDNEDPAASHSSMPTDYPSLFYHSMRRPFKKFTAKVPTKQVAPEEAMDEAAKGLQVKHPPVEKTPPAAETPPASTSASLPKQETSPFPSGLFEEPIAAPTFAPIVAERKHSEEPIAVSTTTTKNTEDPFVLHVPSEKLTQLLQEIAGATKETSPQPFDLLEEPKEASLHQSDLLEEPTTVPVSEVKIANEADGEDLSTVASQTIIASPNTSPRESPMFESLLSLKVDDASVPEGAWKAIQELEEEKHVQQNEDKPTKTSPCGSVQSKQNSTLPSNEGSHSSKPPSENSQDEVGVNTRDKPGEASDSSQDKPDLGASEDRAGIAGGLDANAFVKVGETLRQPPMQSVNKKVAASAKALFMRRVLLVTGFVVLAMLWLTDGMRRWKMVGSIGLTKQTGLDNMASTGHDLDCSPSGPGSTASSEDVTDEFVGLEEPRPYTDSTGNEDEQSDSDDNEEDDFIVNASSCKGFSPCEESLDGFSSTTLPPRVTTTKDSEWWSPFDKPTTQVFTAVETTGKQEDDSPFNLDMFGRYLLYMIELKLFYKPAYRQLLAALVGVILSSIIMVSTVFCMYKLKRIQQEQQQEPAEPAAEAIAPALKEEDENTASAAECSSSTRIVDQIALENYTYLRKQDLKILLRARGLKVSGNKCELIERLVEDYHEELLGLKYRGLQRRLKAAELKATGKKEALVHRLLEAGF